jgi:hypothetical protein
VVIEDVHERASVVHMRSLGYELRGRTRSNSLLELPSSALV